MTTPLLTDAVIIIGLSVLALLLFRKIKVPAILAFFITGLLAGPHGLGLVPIEEVNVLAELGVIFLLFTIGIEFSLEKFSQIKRYVLIGGSLQLIFTLAAVYFICLISGFNTSESIFIGLLISFSSTAVVLRLLQEKDQIYSIHGQIALGILIFQDIAVVLVLLFTPLLAGVSTGVFNNIPALIAMGIGLVCFTIVSTKWAVPWLIHSIARFKNRELFVLTIILICFGVTWITSSIGLSTALGAFLAGLIISNTDYSHQALGNILPFKDIFMSFFFVSIGMLLNIGFIIDHILIIALIAILAILLKSIMAGITTGLLGLSFRVMILVGLLLSQIGEFSFILAATGLQLGLITQEYFQIFLAVSVITMSLTPFVMAAAPRISNYSERLPLPERLKHGFYPFPSQPEEVLTDHLIIVGFGVNGKNMAKAASKAKIPYVIVEINPEIVRNEKAHGESIHFGDAAHETVLENINIKEAKIMVVAISDAVGTNKIIDIAKKLNPNIYIIVRTRYIRDMDSLYQMGADEVIPEEFETSIEIFSKVLEKYNVPSRKINDFIHEIRADGYEMFRTISNDQFITSTLNEGQYVEITSITLSSASEGKTIRELIKNYELEVVAVMRGYKTYKNVDSDLKLVRGDMVIVSGEKEQLAKFTKSDL
ncbi:MAG: monovalent cation:H+ antiporter-2, family [Methanobacterium sp.]|jgi:CPA2 family monovalent cation:H+ antiporter-2|uniref:cation:proton antiporter n=1 Tax=Methanobacterium sp. TaxID=2164 RepID=UPI0003C985C9|nr:cation:proton antiporter [Methanobacterium sp.]MDI3550819.1 monovalent cation:H+ antiporter-2, family [Methanobacterium sp.]CDG65717.1 sodium/hydrogen exchanger [Methanobacterium sp. MB1]